MPPCGSLLKHGVDLGHQPPSNAYLTAEQLLGPEITYPLQVYLCTNCWLVQLPAHATAEELFTPVYAYFSSTSTSWCAHAEHFVEQAVQRLGLGENSHVGAGFKRWLCCSTSTAEHPLSWY